MQISDQILAIVIATTMHSGFAQANVGGTTVTGHVIADSGSMDFRKPDHGAHSHSAKTGVHPVASNYKRSILTNNMKDEQEMKAALKSLFVDDKYEQPLHNRQLQQLNYWTQVGDLDGEAAGDLSGWPVTMSSDGKRVAIGARYNDGKDSSAGHVRVFDYNKGSWTQVGSDLDGEAGGDSSGRSVAMSSDGNRLAIGSLNYNGTTSKHGHVRVYDYKHGSWTQVGDVLDGEAAVDEYGRCVVMSSDGKRLAIGARKNDGNGDKAGHVRVYDFTGSSWTQVGKDIDGEAAGDMSGASVAMSSDGKRLAIGADENDGNGTKAGHVRVFDFTGSVWNQVGEDIDGEAAGDLSGFSVAMSSDGKRLAIGAKWNDGNGDKAGHVRVFDYKSDSNSWDQVGDDLDGKAAGDQFGYSVAMSSDGNRLAIGGRFNDDTDSNAGHVRVYYYKSDKWIQIGKDLLGEAGADEFGYSVAMSSDGYMLAIGAPKNGGNGTDAGHVRMFAAPSTWDIDFTSMSADFSVNSTDELTLNYDIGQGPDQDVNVLPLLDQDCKTNVTGIIVNASSHVWTPNNSSYKTLTLGYSLNKSAIANSSIWNSTLGQLGLCQKVQLVTEGNNNTPSFVIVEDIRKIVVDFNLLANFQVLDTELGAATINTGNGTTKVDSYLQACQCSGTNYTCNKDALVPNTKLVVCIYSTSTDVGIDHINHMVVSQDQDTTKNMTVISDKGIAVPSIASSKSVGIVNGTGAGIVVSTRVPTNIFDFNSSLTLKITGDVVMKLAGDSNGRTLRASVGNSLDTNEETSFSLQVALKQELVSVEGSMSSAAFVPIVSNSFFAALGMVFCLAYAMW